MHIHLPKGLHSLREVAREIGIIVIGVLIALFFEQLVQRWEWRHKVAAAESAMRREIFYDDGPEMVQRAAIQPCIDAQLNAIRAAAEGGKDRAEIAGLVDRLYLPFVTYDSVEQRNAAASDVSTHMAKGRVAAWTQAYAMIPMLDATSTTESIDGARVHAFLRTGGPVDAAERRDLVQAVEAVRADGVRMLAGIGWSMTVVPVLGGSFDKERLGGFMRGARLHYGQCVRDLPVDWPNTLLPPLPAGLTPGLAVSHKFDPIAASQEAEKPR